MKKTMILLTAAVLFLNGCGSYNEMNGVMGGSSLGGIFGSAVGGIIGGRRGADIGTVVGMIGGAVAGSQVAKGTTRKQQERTEDRNRSAYPDRRQAPADEYGYNADGEPLEYGRYEEKTFSSQPARYQALEVDEVRFSDANDNRTLDAGEKAYLEMNIYNRSNDTLYNVAPRIVSDNKRILISPTAIIAKLGPGNGVHYRAAVIGDQRLKTGTARFSVLFGDSRAPFEAKHFNIRTQKK